MGRSYLSGVTQTNIKPNKVDGATSCYEMDANRKVYQSVVPPRSFYASHPFKYYKSAMLNVHLYIFNRKYLLRSLLHACENFR